MTVYLVHSGKPDPVTIKMQAESPAHVPTMITGDPGMVSYAKARADRGSTVSQIAAGCGTYSYLEREDGQEEPRSPSFDELLAELGAAGRGVSRRAYGRRRAETAPRPWRHSPELPTHHRNPYLPMRRLPEPPTTPTAPQLVRPAQHRSCAANLATPVNSTATMTA